MFQISFQWLGPWGHDSILIIMVLSIIWTIKTGICRMQLPKDTSVKRHLEKVNGLEHRPLSVSSDCNSNKEDLLAIIFGLFTELLFFIS